jgi:3-methyladenine DNA glycosylase/8-oxoguanine DNA glycosylase
MAGPSTGAELALVGAGGEPVDLWRTISSHGVADLPPNRIDDEQRTLEVTLAVARGKPRTAVISQGRPGYARVEMRGGKPDAVLDTVRHLLGLDADLSPFYELVAGDPDLAWVANGAGRMLRSPTVFEEVVKTICTTNCAWSGTVRMVSSLVEHLGTPSAGASPGPFGRAFPTPEAMADAGVDFYRDIARAGYRGHTCASSPLRSPMASWTSSRSPPGLTCSRTKNSSSACWRSPASAPTQPPTS